MKKYEILYDWPIDEITRLADSDVAEDFSSNLADTALSSFTTITEQMRGLSADLARAKAERTHFDKWEELRGFLESFAQQFPGFPLPAFRKFGLFVLLANKIAQTACPLDTVDINESAFAICDLQHPLPIDWFSHENTLTFEDSVAVFSASDMAALENSINNSSLSPKLAFQLLASLSSLQDAPSGHAAMVKKVTPPIETAAIEAFVRLVILATGEPIHSPQRYPNQLSVINPNLIRAGNVYHQWNDVLNVLSEYNSRSETLLKYLTIYHVIENFMYKHPLVELERQHGGRMFSIRDFQRMYRQIDDSELNALKRFFTAILKMDATPGTSFEKRIVAKWKNLVLTTPAANIEHILGELGIKKDRRPLKHSEFKPGNECAGYFSQMVYAFRCAIVHNKETEFHLTHASLNPATSALLEAFLIPSLEEISFALVGSPNSQVWYSSKHLLLYQ